MRKIILSICLILLVFNANAQEDEKLPTNQVKINVAYLIAGIPEIGYSYIINQESTVGVDVFFSIVGESDMKFAITPNYRFYFGNDYANGFFVEGFGSLNIIETETYEDYDFYEYKDETDFALGFAIGGKFVTNNNFVFEIYGGVGRNLFNKQSEDIIPRAGVTFGKRF